MKMKTYRAFTMAEAIAEVKRDLGDDAIILTTRRFQRAGFLGLRRKIVVEVVATPNDAEPQRQRRAAATARTTSPNGAAARHLPRNVSQAYQVTNSSGSGPAEDHQADSDEARRSLLDAESAQSVSDADREKTRQFARAMLERLEREQPAAAVAVQAGDNNEHSASPSLIPTGRNQVPTTTVESEAAQRFVLKRADQATTDQPTTDADSPEPADNGLKNRTHQSEHQQRNGSHPPEQSQSRSAEMPAPTSFQHDHQHNQLEGELTAIRNMVGQVLQGQLRSGSTTPKMPQQLFDMYLKLTAQDLSEELADQIVQEARAELSEDAIDDRQQVAEAVRRQLVRYIPCAESPLMVEPRDDRPLTVALVGPTGVGKTTTLAKLAATFKLHQGRKVGLITSDTYRIAAVDQLRTYANIIGLPLEVVLSPAEMEQATARLSDCDVILIDTAGRSQNDSSRLAELKQFIQAADPHEVHLVLSSTAGQRVLLHEAEAFAQVGVDRIVFTKLDEAVSFGMLIQVARQMGKQLSYLTTGQEVPDHIEVGRAERLAELVLAGEVPDARA